MLSALMDLKKEFFIFVLNLLREIKYLLPYTIYFKDLILEFPFLFFSLTLILCFIGLLKEYILGLFYPSFISNKLDEGLDFEFLLS